WDLSCVEFMDSCGRHVLFDAVSDARSGRRKLEVRDDLSPQVPRLCEPRGLERCIFPAPAAIPATPAASPGRGSPLGTAHPRMGDTRALTMTPATGLS
ncbi:MAG: hypothetical protein ACJ780_01190, partial [Solirubrobacteraceae bacterium]